MCILLKLKVDSSLVFKTPLNTSTHATLHFTIIHHGRVAHFTSHHTLRFTVSHPSPTNRHTSSSTHVHSWWWHSRPNPVSPRPLVPTTTTTTTTTVPQRTMPDHATAPPRRVCQRQRRTRRAHRQPTIVPIHPTHPTHPAYHAHRTSTALQSMHFQIQPPFSGLMQRQFFLQGSFPFQRPSQFCVPKEVEKKWCECTSNGPNIIKFNNQV